MKRKMIVPLLFVITAVWLGEIRLTAQQAPPDTILFNGKLVTMNEHGINGNLGTIAQAIAIRGDSIVAVGSDAQIRALAGPNTKSMDLKGRMVTPGMAATHDHPMDWDPLNPYIIRKVVNDNMHIERFLWEEPPEQQVQMLPRLLEEAVQKAKPGQWIRISMLYGKEYKGRNIIQGSFGRQLTKQMLDMTAPNNPVILRAGFVGVIVNQKAIEETKKWYSNWGFTDFSLIEAVAAEKTGVCSTCYREVEQDVLYSPETFKEIVGLGTSWWAGYGLTTNGSALYTAGALNAYNALDREGRMDIRIPWSWLGSAVGNEIFKNPYFLAAMNVIWKRGSDYLWNVGVWPASSGSDCTTLPGTSPQVKQNEAKCNFDPATEQGNRQAFYNSMKAGNRFSAAHTGGDKDIDYILELIEQGSKDSGMTPDQIRAKRHVYDHLAISPRPDQIPRIKNLGMMLGGWDMYIYEGRAQTVLKNYGEEAAQWVVPRKNILDAGVRQSVEIDRPFGYTDLTFFTILHAGITRKDQEGNINAPQQAISREVMLKSATLSGGYYALREDKMGSLEPGRFADLVVLDRDYLTIPVDDIAKIRVLMTMLGGKVVHLVPSLAREAGMQPTGSQITLGGPAAQW